MSQGSILFLRLEGEGRDLAGWRKGSLLPFGILFFNVFFSLDGSYFKKTNVRKDDWMGDQPGVVRGRLGVLPGVSPFTRDGRRKNQRHFLINDIV